LAGTFIDENRPAGSYVFLEVNDTGVGISPQNVPKIFDPFYSTKSLGRGLGLSAVLGIVRGHQGAIRVSSEAGRGSTFRVLLPALEVATAPSRLESSEPPSEVVRGTVLVVDDEASIQNVARRMLLRLGFQVAAASDGEEAVAVFGADPQRFTVVLLDLTMPNMDGEECFRELRRIRPDVPVILSSGYYRADLMHRFAGQGLAGFIQKPYQLATLERVMSEALK
jgi:CheY-like chemotaxis protein